ncbi:hypothetical protein AAFC00_003334 [Neodothiora populina]|uniref:Thymidylate kinase n=1 Tax=Neodothiora populina TaxID=2781224 RepID=A0ABR3PBD2_9PEZI
MTTVAAMAVPRQPFSALASPRLQHLQSSKNRQNGLPRSPLCSDNKPSVSVPAEISSFNPPTKRRVSPSDMEDEFDAENIDPSSLLSSSKRSKTNDGNPLKAASSSLSPAFSLISTPNFSFKSNSSTSMPPPSSAPSRRQTPSQRLRANMSSPRVPLTAPAGRSPKAKRDSRGRRVSVPCSRTEPKSIARASSSSSALPFSLDAALAGSLSKPSAPKPAVKTIEESMPQDWFFDIYEDSPEEEAANLMEHSTLTLDLSSDDESAKLKRNDIGKENVAPPDYESPSISSGGSRALSETSSVTRSGKHAVTRRKIIKPDEMDDGERSPLSDLETEDFFGSGVGKDDFFVVPGSPAKNDKISVAEVIAGNDTVSTASPATGDEDDLVIGSRDESEENVPIMENASTPKTVKATSLTLTSVANQEGDSEGEILIWEDHSDTGLVGA